jgi:predicted  nucleic acid-binding Zn-ribbon protein
MATQGKSGFPMARRVANKARSKGAPVRAPSQRGKAKTEGRDRTAQQRLAALERERDSLRAELEKAEERLTLLEKNQADVSDRIAWALDSLHNILQGKG